MTREIGDEKLIINCGDTFPLENAFIYNIIRDKTVIVKYFVASEDILKRNYVGLRSKDDEHILCPLNAESAWEKLVPFFHVVNKEYDVGDTIHISIIVSAALSYNKHRNTVQTYVMLHHGICATTKEMFMNEKDGFAIVKKDSL